MHANRANFEARTHDRTLEPDLVTLLCFSHTAPAATQPHSHAYVNQHSLGAAMAWIDRKSSANEDTDLVHMVSE